MLAAAAALAPVLAAKLPEEGCVRLLREARIARMEGADARELELLRQAEREYPGEALPLMALMERAVRKGARAEERARLLTTLEERVRSVDAAVPDSLLGLAAEDPTLSGETLAAVRSAVAARLARSPADPALLDASARLAARMEDWASALDALGKLGGIRPGLDVDRRRLEAAAALERWSDVVELGRRVAESDPPAPEVHLLVGRALVELDRAGEARTEIAPLLADPGQHADAARQVLLPLAWRLWDAGKDDEAREAFRAAADADPGGHEARQALEALFGSVEKRSASRGVGAAGLDVASPANTYFVQGGKLLSSGDTAGAVERFHAAVVADPEFEPAWYNLGVAAWKLKRWDDARSAFARSASLNPSRAQSVFMLGASLVRLGRCPEAVKELERALAMSPELRDAHSFLAECYRKLGRTAEADEELRRAGARR